MSALPASLNNNNPSHPWPCPVIVTGPTGVGKSSFAVTLAERLGGEIIGADAFQIYGGLPILTASPGPDLLSRVPHHLIGVIPPEETCDAARYAKSARQCIQEISGRGRVPILVGGSGLYLKALTHGLADLPPVDPVLRAEISALDPATALARLRENDPDAPAQIDAQNPVRVRRALEIVLSSGRPLAESRSTWTPPAHASPASSADLSPEGATSRSLGQTRETVAALGVSSNKELCPEGATSPRDLKPAPIIFRGIVLYRDRDILRQRIADNVEALFASGVIEEVRLAKNIGPTASRAIGLHKIQSLIRGECTLPECKEAIITATRRYAKRQITWCRNQFPFPSIDAGSPDHLDAVLASVFKAAETHHIPNRTGQGSRAGMSVRKQ